MSEPAYAEAAVSLVIRTAGTPELLLIRRAHSDGDPWSGHMALPGGRRDPGDRSTLDTAVRETQEEVGVDLASVGTLLGRLDDVRPVSRRLPRLSISPMVFTVPAETRARVASPEVASVHWVPLPLLRSGEARGSVDISLPAGVRAFPCFYVDGEAVWGLTYRILTAFLEAYPEL